MKTPARVAGAGAGTIRHVRNKLPNKNGICVLFERLGRSCGVDGYWKYPAICFVGPRFVRERPYTMYIGRGKHGCDPGVVTV